MSMTKKNTPLRISVIREMQYLPWVFKYSSSMDKMLTVFGNLKNCFNHGFDVSNDVRGINVDFTLLSSDGFDRFDYNHKVFNGFLNRQKKKSILFSYSIISLLAILLCMYSILFFLFFGLKKIQTLKTVTTVPTMITNCKVEFTLRERKVLVWK